MTTLSHDETRRSLLVGANITRVMPSVGGLLSSNLSIVAKFLTTVNGSDKYDKSVYLTNVIFEFCLKQFQTKTPSGFVSEDHFSVTPTYGSTCHLAKCVQSELLRKFV